MTCSPDGPSSKQSPPPHLWDVRWVRDLAILLGSLAILWLAYTIRSITAPILIGLGFAYVFNPLVTLVHTRLHWPRWMTTSIILIMAYVMLIAALLWVLPPAIRQTVELSSTVSRFAAKHADVLEPYWQTWIQQNTPADTSPPVTPHALPDDDPSSSQANASTNTSPDVNPSTTSAAANKNSTTTTATNPQAPVAPGLKQTLQTLQVDYAMVGRILLRTLNIGIGAIGSVFSMTTYLGLAMVIISFCFFFFSWKLALILAWFEPLIPLDIREQTLDILGKMDHATNAFIRGRLIQAAVMGGVLSLGWWAVGVPSWLLLGLLCGILNLVPYVAVLGWLVAVTLSAMHGSSGDQTFTFSLILWPSVIYLIAQLLDGWVVEPLVQGKATNLDPLTVMLSVMIGGALMGLLGMLLAIPLASCLKILGTQWLVPQLREYAQSRVPETSPEAPPEVSPEAPPEVSPGKSP